MNVKTKEEIEQYIRTCLHVENMDINSVIEMIYSNTFFNWFTQENNKKEILVPDNILIIKNDNGQLGIGFNEYKQALSFNKGINTYQVLPVIRCNSFPQCKLEICRYEDIQVGDIFINSYTLNNALTELDGYLIRLSEETICFIQDSDCVISTYYAFEEYAEDKLNFYKLVEVNKK